MTEKSLKLILKKNICKFLKELNFDKFTLRPFLIESILLTVNSIRTLKRNSIQFDLEKKIKNL